MPSSVCWWISPSAVFIQQTVSVRTCKSTPMYTAIHASCSSRSRTVQGESTNSRPRRRVSHDITYEKQPRKSFRMRSYKIIGLKVPWNHTLPKKRGRGVVRQSSASLPLLRVPAEEPVPTDGEHFAKHAQAVANHVHLGLWVVRPTHGN